ncbi:MAG: AAA family ATPase, partial [Lacipirellulaceae bacterium]
LQTEGASVPDDLREDTLSRHSKLTSEQRLAVDELLQSNNSLRFLHGMAGTGKTIYVLRACVEAWKKQGYEVIGAAPTGRASIELADSVGIETSTLHSMFADFDPEWGFKAKHHIKQFARAMKGKRTYRYKKPAPRRLNARQVLIVDESGMVNLRHNQMLFDEIKRSGATILFTGDPYQLSPVEGTAPFLALSERCGYSKLEDIQRQVEGWARDAARYFAKGQPGKALALYEKRNQIRVSDTKDAAIQQMVLDWTGEGLTTPEKAVILCSTNADCEVANQLCQKKALDAGWLRASQCITVKDDQGFGRSSEADIHVHDRVQFTQNSTKYGVENGTLGVVIAMDAIAKKLAIRLDNGKTVRIPLKRYSNIRLGYALTTYKAQGATVDHAYVLAGGRMQDLPTTYVQATRARLRTTFYGQKSHFDECMDNIEESPLAQQMATRPDLSMAADLLQPPDATSDSKDEVLSTLVGDYLKANAKLDCNTLILTRTSVEAEELNKLCHERLAQESASVLESANGLRLVPGDRITFNQPPYMETRIKRGERGKVVSVDEQSGFIRVAFDEHKMLIKEEAMQLEAKRLDLARAHALTQAQAKQSASNVEEIYNYQTSQDRPITQGFDTQQYAQSGGTHYTCNNASSWQPFSVQTSTWADDYTKQYNYLYQGAGSNHLQQQMYNSNQQFNTFTQQSTQTQYQAITQTNAWGQAY